MGPAPADVARARAAARGPSRGRLLGSGLPSLWIIYMGDMRLVLALSGWTANDWTSGSNLDLMAGAIHPTRGSRIASAATWRRSGARSIGELGAALNAPDDALVAALHLLAKRGAGDL